MTLATGTRLGPYEIVGAVGAGGMGEVYRARDTKLGRDVAIKVLPDLFASDPERLARFEREAKTLAALNHQNIAQVHGHVDLPPEGGSHIVGLVMEFVDGEDLSQRIERGAMPLDDVVAVARQIAEALEAAHEHGIIHRDLKPANIKVTGDGSVKVLDFGLAKALDPVSQDIANSPTLTMRATQAGVILGTAAYMAPEQARGKTVDRRADIWAFGAVLYEMLTGRRAFEGETVSDLIASVIKERVALEQLPADLPPSVRRLIERCLEKDPKLRLRDIGEARILLSQPLVESKTPAQTIVPAGARPAGATPRLLTAVAVLLAIGLLGALTALWQRSSAPSRGFVRFDVLPPEGTEVGVIARPSLTVSPDGSMIVYAATTNGVSHLYMRRRDSVESRQLAGTQGASHPVFSPDGAWIAFIAGNDLAKVPLDGPVISITKVNDPRGLAWIDRSSLVYTPDAVGGLMRTSADGGAPTLVTTPDADKGQRTHRWPSALPGRKAVLYTVGLTTSPDDYDGSAIEAVTLATGKRQTVLQGASMAAYVVTGHLLFARGGALHAVPFDPSTLQITGDVVPVLQGVMGDRTTGAAHVAIGSDGTLAYIPGTSRGALRVMLWVDAEGKTRPVDVAPAQHNDLRISPDGTRVAFVQGTSGVVADVWVFDLQRKSLTRLTFDGTNSTPVWSADGKSIYYASIDKAGSKTTLLRKPADGSREAEPMGAMQWRGYFKEVLADGTAIVETVRTGPKADVLRIALTPGKLDIIAPTSLVATPADEYASDVSPDGRWLAYNSDESGRYEVYVRDLSGGGGRWQISTAGGEEPHWSPDGRRLYYRFDDALFAVSIEARNVFSPGTPQLLFRGVHNLRSDTGMSFDVDPKSGGLLMMRPAVDQKSRNTIRVVLNWFDDLKSKFPH